MNHRVLLVRIDNRDRALSDYLAEAQRKIDQSVNFDQSKYRLEWGGQFENQQRAQARLTVILGLVLALMMVFLFAEFGKMRQAVLILGVVPLATLGGLIALHLTGETLNVASAVGFIALFGVAVQNGIIMISNINRVREQGLYFTRPSSSGRDRTLPAGADDCHRGDRWDAAGGLGHRHRYRCAARARHRCGGRLDNRHSADIVYPAHLLLCTGAVGRTAQDHEEASAVRGGS